jgi:hypothetical protein
MTESIFLFYCAGISFVLFLAILGGILGFSLIKIAQRSAPHITSPDVSTVTRAWAISFGLGGMISFVFLGIVDAMVADFIEQALYFAIVFAMIGISVCFIGVKSLFRQVGK